MKRYRCSTSPPVVIDPLEHSLASLVGVAITRRDLAQRTVEALRRQCSNTDEAFMELARAEGASAAWDAIANMLADVLKQRREGGA